MIFGYLNLKIYIAYFLWISLDWSFKFKMNDFEFKFIMIGFWI